ncbi:oxidoreductase [Aeromicrobium sp. PE09-221]|uniref:molybdopterin-dependent oxidoreductase n=1 Tax=Aeromicrobium sp. PE09-221 TaxID=1898043 RepID=UPI000B3E607A|nr:molybdopterin-dependent oxidoreductase [Aeromicrobium sp. PE09-221]OUZ09975.1 oxidoreductase [Aeromicrobium sp. PE09-221]
MTAPQLPHDATVGVIAATAGIGIGHLVAALTNPSASPVLSIGSAVIDATPTPVKEWAVATFGTSDKIILIGSVALGTLVLAGLGGVIAARRFSIGALVLIALVALAGAAALTRPAATVADLLPALATGVMALAALWWLVRERDPANAESGGGPTRRRVLTGGGAVLVAAVLAGAAGEAIIRGSRRLGDIVLPRPSDPPPPLADGLDIEGISPFRTPTEDFYRVDVNLSVPVVDVDDWALTIDGDVARPYTITWDELLEMDMIERDITMTCVSNEVGGGYVGATRWLGVPLTDLLERAGIGSRADQILSTAVDGFTISTPLAIATDGRDAMVAIAMDGEPLPREHGFPARLITPGLYGYVGATKWLERLTLTTYASDRAYWTERGWDIDGPIKVSTRIDTPRGLAELDPGDLVIAGVAWAQHRGVEGVQVRIDGGEWTDAELGPDAGVDYWRQWYLPWKAGSGRHTVQARCVTDDGEVQTAERAGPFPNGSSGIHDIVVRVA